MRISIPVPAESALERCLGCWMVGMMPDRGLEEALYALKDMLEFYGEELPEARALPEGRTITAVVVGREKRPDLFITP